MKKMRVGARDIILLLIPALLLAGILSVFQPCSPREDGSWMSCHWAGRATAGAAGAMLALSLLRLFVSKDAKKGLDLALIVLSVLAALLPGRLISLCMMRDMRCHTLTAPCAAVLSGLTALAALVDLLLSGGKGRRHEA